ncbi:MAG: hypothetical protein ACYTG5_02480, partial [Planctomycetota bacterium]
MAGPDQELTDLEQDLLLGVARSVLPEERRGFSPASVEIDVQDLLAERESVPDEQLLGAIRRLVNLGLFAAGRLDEEQGSTGHLVSIWLTGE